MYHHKLNIISLHSRFPVTSRIRSGHEGFRIVLVSSYLVPSNVVPPMRVPWPQLRPRGTRQNYCYLQAQTEQVPLLEFAKTRGC